MTKKANLLRKEQMTYVPKDGATSGYYTGELLVPFNLTVARECYNLRRSEGYKNVNCSKGYELYEAYERKGSQLVGKGKKIGTLAYFTGIAYRSTGCSFMHTRAKGVGILLNPQSKMGVTLKQCGLDDKLKPMRFKNLTANGYLLVCHIIVTEYDNGTCLNELALGLKGDDGSFIDLTRKWTECLTEDFS